jgi:predicted dehydrogenase
VTKSVGVIGAGSIVPFHIEALIAAGFTIDSIASRTGSEKAAALNVRYQPAARADSAHDVIARNPDALLIASDVSSLPQLLAEALKGSSKILIEKPVSYSVDVIRSLMGIRDEDVLVGYNRRFYSSVDAATKFVRANSGTTFQATIAEASSNAFMTAEQKRNILLANSVHVLDMLQAVFGRFTVITNIVAQDATPNDEALALAATTRANGEPVNLTEGMLARLVNVVSESGNIGNINLYFGAPANFAVDIYAQGRFAQMRPLENFIEYDGIVVHEPTTDVPIRTYRPKPVEPAFKIAQRDLDLKPGFLQQARALHAMTEGIGVSSLPAGASLADALSVLELAERIARGSSAN